MLYSVTTLDPNQILSTYLDVITATAISLAEGSDGVAQAIAVGKNWAGLTPQRPEAGSEDAKRRRRYQRCQCRGAKRSRHRQRRRRTQQPKPGKC